jgi:hypothetical protein
LRKGIPADRDCLKEISNFNKHMTTAADQLIDEASNYYFQQLTDKMIYTLKKLPQGYRQNPDCSLANLWEEICVQNQTDYWEGWYLTLGIIELQCSLLIAQQDDIVKRILNFEFVERDSLAINEEEICEKLVNTLLDKAMNYSNNRIEKFI